MKSLILALAVFTSAMIYADAEPGKPAPDFIGIDASGKNHRLADYKGKWLVLEWFNKDCPFVHKHYDSGNMQKLQKAYTGKGVVWLQVVSSAPGNEGYVNGPEMLAIDKDKKAAATAAILDPQGTIGHAYGAKTTPHMFVIDPNGIVVYVGAIDDNSSTDQAVIPTSTNYVVAALDAAMNGKKVEKAQTKSYGCSVKYKN